MTLLKLTQYYKRQTDRAREKERETETERQRDRDRETERETETDRQRRRQTQRDTDRHREVESGGVETKPEKEEHCTCMPGIRSNRRTQACMVTATGEQGDVTTCGLTSSAPTTKQTGSPRSENPIYKTSYKFLLQEVLH